MVKKMKNKEKYDLRDLDFLVMKNYDCINMSTDFYLRIDLKGIGANHLAEIHICSFPYDGYYDYEVITGALEKFTEWLEKEYEEPAESVTNL